LPAPVIHWFRQDLRLEDNPALRAAVAAEGPVIPVYILDDQTPGKWALGGASRWWLHYSLCALRESLRALGSDLVLRRGPPVDVLAQLIAETGAATVFMTRCYEPHAAALEPDLAQALKSQGVGLRRFGGNLLFEPEAIENREGRPYRVFTPFYKAFQAKPWGIQAADRPDVIPRPTAFPSSDRLEEWALTPTAPDWSVGLRETWTPGEAGARARLSDFLEAHVQDYVAQRDRPDTTGTSRLSPHLHFGEISPRTCWQQARLAAEQSEGGDGHAGFLRELVWREFSYHLLHHLPEIPASPLRPEFARFPWRDDAEHLAAWQRGRTGYPIVDAGMRELWHTGWMHNRVRMIAASFLVKDLLIPWQSGAAWFWDTLVDADLANNSASWQWVAGCGADAAPFFRIFNPVTQGEKFDSGGLYVRRWVPELANVPDRYLHKPWTAPESILERAGVILGKDYPHPVVDHAAARHQALAAFKSLSA
jgi:deoxyribodipyrimidine photo-lyase